MWRGKMPETSEPCPCGSGKPYEKCCGRRKVFYSLEQARWRRAGHDLRRSLGQYADRQIFSWDAARAQDLYLGLIDKKLVDSDDDFIMERCFEWFIFDYRLYGGQTILETYQDEYRHSLSEREAVLLHKWAVSYNSLYEVTAVLPDEELTIKDILTRREIKIYDVNTVLEIEQGSMLLMRVLEVGEEYEFSTSGLVLPGRYKRPILKKLHRDRLDFCREQKTMVQGWGLYLKERAHVINAWVMDMGVDDTRQSSDAPEKDTAERMAVLPIASWEEVLETIKKTPQYNLVGETSDAAGAFRQATAAILGENHHAKAALRPVIGHLVLTSKFIILHAGTAEQLSVCRDRLMKLFQENIIRGTDNWPKRRHTSSELDGDTGCLFKTGREMDTCSWPELSYAVVAVNVREGLQALGYSLKQQKGAVRLWYDYCSKERPVIRKTAVWAATVIYTFAWLEKEAGLNQSDLASRYSVASSTISSRFGLLRRSLKLVAKDTRYVTKMQ
jgi:hypothetical protein